MDRRVEALIREQFPEARCLQQVNGVDPINALTLVATLADPARFPTSRKVGVYLGLIRRQRQLGANSPQRAITKHGRLQLRVLLVEAAHNIAGSRVTIATLGPGA